MDEKKHVVIIGAGFAGIWAMKVLKKKSVKVTLIDRNNYHTFLPLLYQVGAAEIEPEEIAYPVRNLIRKYKNVRFISGEVTHLKIKDKYCICNGVKIPFDYCIVSPGSSTNFYNIPGAEKYSFVLKSLDDSIILRNHVLTCFERASYCDSPEERKALLSFNIIGSGATGIEFAGALSELIRGPLKKDYPAINFGEVSVNLIEASGRLLSMFSEKLGSYAGKKLVKKGIHVLLDSRVEEVTGNCIGLSTGQVIPTKTVVWTAGVKGACEHPLWELPLENGKVITDKYLQVKGANSLYAAGDAVHIEGLEDNYPMVAPVATQQGTAAANNICLEIKGKPKEPFRYRDRGGMVTIGRNSAVARIGSTEMKGFFAWIIWLVIHIMNLIGFRNKILVMINWAIDYLFYERAVRLILPRCCGSPSAASCERRRNVT